MPQEFWSNAIYSLTPTILVGLIFWFVMRAIFRADRTERSVYAKIEAEERARLGLQPRAVASETPAQLSESAAPGDPAAR